MRPVASEALTLGCPIKVTICHRFAACKTKQENKTHQMMAGQVVLRVPVYHIHNSLLAIIA